MKQIKMFYIASKIEKDTQKVNDFLREKGEDVVAIQMDSTPYTGGDTIDTIMVIYKEEEGGEKHNG